MELDKAQEFFQDLYDNHAPTKRERKDGSWYWDSCNGGHYVWGYEWDVETDDNNYCPLYVQAAEVLGLPLLHMETPPPWEPENTPLNNAIKKLYGDMIERALQPYRVAPKPDGTVTFQIAD